MTIVCRKCFTENDSSVRACRVCSAPLHRYGVNARHVSGARQVAEPTLVDDIFQLDARSAHHVEPTRRFVGDESRWPLLLSFVALTGFVLLGLALWLGSMLGNHEPAAPSPSASASQHTAAPLAADDAAQREVSPEPSSR